MSGINLSLNPTYLCNFRCNFCYLTKKQLADSKKIAIIELKQMLDEVSQMRTIEHIDIYGGEIGMLPDSYQIDLLETVKSASPLSINIITNLSMISPVFLDDQIDLSVSWDFRARQDFKKVFNNILNIHKDIHILMLASPTMLDWSDEVLNEAINIINSAANIKTVEIKPYSQNQANSYRNTDQEFEDFIIKWLKKSDEFKFTFLNKQLIQESLEQRKSSWSDDHLYITPDAKWAVLDFDDKDREFFLKLDSLSDYKRWYTKERNTVENNSVCKNCKYLGNCLSEHLRYVAPEDKSCSGFRNLLAWSEKNLKF